MRDDGRYYNYRDIVNELPFPMTVISFPRFYEFSVADQTYNEANDDFDRKDGNWQAKI
jgi:hypothetical protein